MILPEPPRSVASVKKLAEAEGWTVRLTMASGPWQSIRGDVLDANCESWLLRGMGPRGRFAALWVARPGKPFKLELAYATVNNVWRKSKFSELKEAIRGLERAEASPERLVEDQEQGAPA